MVTLSRSLEIVAHFTRRPRLSVATCGGVTHSDEIQIRLTGEPGRRHVIEGNEDGGFGPWTARGQVTNVYGVTQFIDSVGPGEARRIYRSVEGP